MAEQLNEIVGQFTLAMAETQMQSAASTVSSVGARKTSVRRQPVR
jgi:hypothetical protein